MKQEEYRVCMAQGLKGKQGLSKAERKILFCTQSKLCSGKAQSEDQGADLCAKSVPKWAKQALPKEKEPLTCPLRMDRVRQTIDAIALGLKSGDTEEILPASAQLLNDLTECGTPEAVELASVAATEVKGLAKRFYLKGEAKDVINQLEVLKELV